MGPPFTTTFKTAATTLKPGGVVVGADVPAANATNQILVSGAGPNYAWGLGTNPAAAASVPAPTAQFQIVLADATPAWQTSTVASIMTLGNAVTTTSGGTFVAGANLVFTAPRRMATRLDGGDSALSSIDNFMIDAGTF